MLGSAGSGGESAARGDRIVVPLRHARVEIRVRSQRVFESLATISPQGTVLHMCENRMSHSLEQNDLMSGDALTNEMPFATGDWSPIPGSGPQDARDATNHPGLLCSDGEGEDPSCIIEAEAQLDEILGFDSPPDVMLQRSIVSISRLMKEAPEPFSDTSIIGFV